MGVPVTSLAGESALSRLGKSVLSAVGLGELAAESPEAFVETTVRLAGDLDRLTRLRAGLRERMRGSPLMDAPRFAQGLETAYRQMWREWCGPTEASAGNGFPLP
jgi:predicted O-linked N-acetylglucosamine transferase (SPINDLY family)